MPSSSYCQVIAITLGKYMDLTCSVQDTKIDTKIKAMPPRQNNI